MIQVTVDWLKEKCKSIELMFTKNHRGLFTQFQEYKERTTDQLQALDTYQDKLKAAEIHNAAQFSVDEGQYAISSKIGLRLYNSLVLELEEHQKIKTMTKEELIVYLQEKQQRTEELQKDKVEYYKNVNTILEERNKQLVEELGLIQWYITVLEDGKDTKDVL